MASVVLLRFKTARYEGRDGEVKMTRARSSQPVEVRLGEAKYEVYM